MQFRTSTQFVSIVLQSIARKQLDELRSLAQPPNPIKLTLEAVLVMLGHEPSALDFAEIRRLIKASLL